MRYERGIDPATEESHAHLNDDQALPARARNRNSQSTVYCSITITTRTTSDLLASLQPERFERGIDMFEMNVQ